MNALDRTQTLLARAREGDAEARERLVEENAALVHAVARRFASADMEREDLFQVGCVGLWKAILRYDAAFGVRFSTYAVPMISGEIKRCLRDGGALKVSRGMKESALRARREAEDLRARLGREPTIGEIAAACGAEPESVALALGSLQTPASLDQPLGEEGGTALGDTVAAAADGLGSEERIVLKEALHRLEGRERQIVLMRFFQEQTQAAVGGRLGMTQVQVSRAEKRILAKLRVLCQ